MKYSIVFTIGLLIIVPLISMEPNGKDAKSQSEAEERQQFKEKFFPDVFTPTLQDVIKACRFYQAIPSELAIFPQVTFEKAKQYAHFHDDKISAIFLRYSNDFMVEAYKPGLSREEKEKVLQQIALTIADDEKRLSYILTGDKTKECNSNEIWDKVIVFAKLVNSYNPVSDATKMQKVLNG